MKCLEQKTVSNQVQFTMFVQGNNAYTFSYNVYQSM